MKIRLIRAAALIVLTALPLALGGCIVVEHRRGYCYYHPC